jgi:hypothetical protein
VRTVVRRVIAGVVAVVMVSLVAGCAGAPPPGQVATAARASSSPLAVVPGSPTASAGPSAEPSVELSAGSSAEPSAPGASPSQAPASFAVPSAPGVRPTPGSSQGELRDPKLVAMLPAVVAGIKLVEDLKGEKTFFKQGDSTTSMLFTGLAVARGGQGVDQVLAELARVNPMFVSGVNLDLWNSIMINSACDFGTIKASGKTTIGKHKTLWTECFMGGEVLSTDLGKGIYAGMWTQGPKELGQKIIATLP